MKVNITSYRLTVESPYGNRLAVKLTVIQIKYRFEKFAMFLSMKSDDEKFLSAALEEARIAFSEGEVPIGCIIVRDGKIIGCGHNRVEQLCDVSAHAEILAIRDAERKVGNWRRNGPR